MTHGERSLSVTGTPEELQRKLTERWAEFLLAGLEPQWPKPDVVQATCPVCGGRRLFAYIDGDRLETTCLDGPCEIPHIANELYFRSRAHTLGARNHDPPPADTAIEGQPTTEQVAAAIDAGDPAMMKPQGPFAGTSCDLIYRAIFEDSVATLGEGAPVREEVPGTHGLLHRGLAHSLFGDRGEGKTIATLILTVAAAAADEGERVLYLDRENGAPLTRSLVAGILEAHEDWPDVLDTGRWVGRHYPTFGREWRPADYAHVIGELGYTGVVYDSLREAISEFGGDPNADEDVSAVQRILITPLLQRGIWVIVLDNVGHTEKGRPKGSGAKLDAVPIAYQVRTVQPFGPDRLGEIAIRCTRSRYGDTDLEWFAELGEGVFDVPAFREESRAEREARELHARYERFARNVVAALEAEQPLGWKELLKRVKGARTETRRAWLTQIVSEEHWEVVHDERSGYSLRRVPRGVSSTPLRDVDTPGTRPSSETPQQSLEDMLLDGTENGSAKDVTSLENYRALERRRLGERDDDDDDDDAS